MVERMTNIELLLMMADDLRAQGDDLTQEINQQGRAHAKRVLEMRERLQGALQAIDAELQRFRPYLPRQEEPMPRVVQQGPKT